MWEPSKRPPLATYTAIHEIDLLQHISSLKTAAPSISPQFHQPEEPCFLSFGPPEDILVAGPSNVHLQGSTFRTLLGQSPRLHLVEQRGDKFAHEAGVYMKSHEHNYFTSNYQSGRTIEVHAVDCATHDVSPPLHYADVVNPNGACKYGEEILFCCQGSFETPSALVAVDPLTGESRILINNFLGRQFNSINDVVVHHARGDIWFTDPTYGYEQAFRPVPQLPSQVYRLAPDGVIQCVADGFVQCNGLCFSPDYSKMYITDTGALQAHAAPAHGLNFSCNPRLPATIYEYDVVANGTRLSNRRMFAYADCGVPDGIKCDQLGNVYSGCGDGVQIWDPNGVLLGKIYTGCIVANFNFAKDGIWLMAEEKLFFCEWGVRGALHATECE